MQGALVSTCKDYISAVISKPLVRAEHTIQILFQIGVLPSITRLCSLYWLLISCWEFTCVSRFNPITEMFTRECLPIDIDKSKKKKKHRYFANLRALTSIPLRRNAPQPRPLYPSRKRSLVTTTATENPGFSYKILIIYWMMFSMEQKLVYTWQFLSGLLSL